MIQKLKNVILGLVAAATMVAPAALVTAPVFADANIQGSLCQGTNFNVTANGGAGNCGTDAQGTSSLNKLLTQVVNIFSAIVGVIAVVMIIVGGLRYITSGGDSNKVSAAKNTLIYAIIGLIIVALAQLIVHFVLQKAGTL